MKILFENVAHNSLGVAFVGRCFSKTTNLHLLRNICGSLWAIIGQLYNICGRLDWLNVLQIVFSFI